MKRFASTRSERRAWQPSPGRAQCSVGSIDEDGIRYGFTTQALIASTMRIAPAIVTIQSIAIRHGRGSRCVSRSTGFRERCSGWRRLRLGHGLGRASASVGRGDESGRGDRDVGVLGRLLLGFGYGLVALRRARPRPRARRPRPR